jgi:SAM-dependent methyltransferase
MKEQQIQEEQYTFPYHYLPRFGEGRFRQHEYWSWGYRYVAGMHVARNLCDEEEWSSLMDLGCGDGRFVSELSRDRSHRDIVGVDYSGRAIALARAMNPGLEYRAADILNDDLDGRQFDVVTLIEVIEHIPPRDLDAFIERAVGFLRPGGRLVLTVPHRNRPVGDKHFQHFDSSMLTTLLTGQVENLRFQPFDYFSRKVDIWFRLMGRTGRYFLITWPPLLDAFFRYYMRHCVYGEDESACSRIACVGWKPGE